MPQPESFAKDWIIKYVNVSDNYVLFWLLKSYSSSSVFSFKGLPIYTYILGTYLFIRLHLCSQCCTRIDRE
jgi:hypothetical protein